MAKLLIGIVLIATIVLGVVIIFPKKGEYDAPRPENDSAFNDTSEEPPVKIKSVGIILDYYNPKTDLAGEVIFQARQHGRKPFEEYGTFREAKDGFNSSYNPQPTWNVPEGTPIRALIDGFVIDVPKLYSNDYSVIVATSMDSRWRYETEHVSNPLVKPGDFVKAGQIVAYPTKFNANNGRGWVEIGIGKGTQDANTKPQHVCIFKYLDDSIKEETLKKIQALMQEWEKQSGNPNDYDEGKMPIPGCLTLDVVDG